SQVADGEVGDVHAAAAPFAVPGFLPEELGKGAIDVLLESILEEFCVRGGFRVRDALPKLRVIHGPDGLTAPRQAVAVATVRAGDVILQVQGAARSHGSAFLADRYVRRAPVIEILDG